MWYYSRDFSADGDDFDRMCSFMIEHNADDASNRDWSLGRLIDWKYGLWHARKTMPEYFGKNARLWLTQLGELVGLAISEDGDDGFQVFAGKRYGFLHTEILACVSESWSSRMGSLNSIVADSDARMIAAFDRAGFVRGTRREATMVYDAEAFKAPDVVVPEGFALLDMSEAGEYAGLMRLRYGACRRIDRTMYSIQA